MKKIVVGLLILLAAFCWANTPPEVSNIEAVQRVDGSKIVDITYDLYDADGDDMAVSVQVSDDGGSSWNVNCATLSGDVGDGVYSGNGKQIVWDFGADNPGEFGDNYKVKVNIDDHYIQQDDDWCTVPAGTYTWGQNDEIQTIDYDYEIMKYEVTNAQYVEYLEEALAAGEITVTTYTVTGYYTGDENYAAGDYEFYDLDDGDNRINWDGIEFVIDPGFDDHPVVEVSWFGSNAYAEHYGLRLPTEQEWEKAARGMTGFEYPCGDNLSGDRANYLNSGDPWDNGTTPVGYYNGENGTTDSPSPYGCYDMCGNVFNWTDSWLNSSSRVLRGGSWSHHIAGDVLRSWYRVCYYPAYTVSHFGFRCARTLP